MIGSDQHWKRPNVLRFSCRLRRAAQDDFKKGSISRAEGGQLQAPVGPLPVFRR